MALRKQGAVMSVYQMHRGWMDHPCFGNVAYSEREAWEWLIGEAAFKDGAVSINGRPVVLKRGQLTASLRFMAQKWRWDKNKVARFIGLLKRWDMATSETETESGTGQTVISICNYTKYQDFIWRGKDSKRDANGTTHGTDAGQTITPSTPKTPSIDTGPPNLPDWLPAKIWNDFVHHRRQQ